jgi:hypothetical protein
MEHDFRILKIIVYSNEMNHRTILEIFNSLSYRKYDYNQRLITIFDCNLHNR